MLLSDAHDQFIEYIRYRRSATKATLITYQSNISMFITQVGDMQTTELSVEIIDEYAKHLMTLGLRPKTFRNRLTIVRSFVKYLYQKNLTDLRPESIELPKNRDPEVAYLTPEESARLLSAATDLRDKAMLSLLLISGLRVSELCNLKRTNILGQTVSVINGKGMKHRVTFMSLQVKELVEAYLLTHTSPYIFPNRQGKEMSRMSVLKIVQKYVKLSGIEKHVTVHTLRHTFATTYLMNGGRIEDLRMLMGHTNVNTTMLYLHFTDSHLHDSYDKIMSVL